MKRKTDLQRFKEIVKYINELIFGVKKRAKKRTKRKRGRPRKSK